MHDIIGNVIQPLKMSQSWPDIAKKYQLESGRLEVY